MLQLPLATCPWRPLHSTSAAAAAAAQNAKKKKGGNDGNAPGVKTMPPLSPVFDPKSSEPIDDYGREGKRTPQQLLVERVVAKNYSRLKMTEHKRKQAERSRRIGLRHKAVAALPEELRAEAMTVDMSDFPVWRQAAGTEIVITYEEVNIKVDDDASEEEEEEK